MNPPCLLSIATTLNAFTAGELADHRLLARALSVLRCQSMVAPILRDVAGDGALLRLAAARSYEHGNGFTKIVLARGDHWALRLHLHRADASAAYHIHDHRWPFASLVLRGTLFEDRYETAAAEHAGAQPWLAFRYAPGAAGFRATQVGRASMLPPALLVHPPGTIYSLPAEQLHALPQGTPQGRRPHLSAPPPPSLGSPAHTKAGAAADHEDEGGCATLVLTGAARDTCCRLYSRPGSAPREVTPKTPLPAGTLWALLLAEAEAAL
jgi:hypothetical protein